MANIVLINKCNLSCCYCFAKDLLNSEFMYFSMENFVKAVNFIKTRKNERIGIVGGEPTIHPNFAEFMEVIYNDNLISNCIIFTNGIEIDKYIDILGHQKFRLLINCNNPQNIGKLYNKLESNLQQIDKIKKTKFTLGINLYSPFMDYSYIFDLLKLTNRHSLRFSVSISNNDKQNCTNIIDYYKQFNNILLNFYNDCLKNEIIPFFDCCSVPICATSTEIKKVQLKIISLMKKLNYKFPIFGNDCSSFIDILPNLHAVRSICFPYYKSVPISDFNSIDLIKEYFYNEIEKYKPFLLVQEKCKTCKYIEKCHICISHKINEFMACKKREPN